MRPKWGIFRSAVVFMLAGMQLSACGMTDVVCPAVGWGSSITVRLEGDVTAVSDVELCTAEGCSVPGLASPQPASPKSAVPDSPGGPSAPMAPFDSSRSAVNSWLFTVRGQLPEQVTARVLAEDGKLLAQRQSRLEWTRVGGSEECGGPMTTQPITLRLSGRPQ